MKRCFVIGPMSGQHISVLRWLAEDVVQKLLPNWEVSTPDFSEIGNIMNHVIKSCDRADLVIANTTANNPNVLYEMAILDALGRACIPVKIIGEDEVDKPPAAPDLMPFDRAAYRYITIYATPTKRSETDTTLGNAISKALEIGDKGDLYDNPITDYFGVTLSSLSSAFGLARGYYINFIKPAALMLPEKKIAGSAFDPTKFSTRRLEIAIPDRLDDVSRSSIEELVKQKVIKQTTLQSKDRKIALFEWTKQEEPTFRWIDFPTTLFTLKGNVLGRLGRNANKNPEGREFKEIEANEIAQFERALQARLDEELAADAGKVKKVVDLKNWAGIVTGP